MWSHEEREEGATRYEQSDLPSEIAEVVETAIAFPAETAREESSDLLLALLGADLDGARGGREAALTRIPGSRDIARIENRIPRQKPPGRREVGVWCPTWLPLSEDEPMRLDAPEAAPKAYWIGRPPPVV